jgi:hypothetical protein
MQASIGMGSVTMVWVPAAGLAVIHMTIERANIGFLLAPPYLIGIHTPVLKSNVTKWCHAVAPLAH